MFQPRYFRLDPEFVCRAVMALVQQLSPVVQQLSLVPQQLSLVPQQHHMLQVLLGILLQHFLQEQEPIHLTHSKPFQKAHQHTHHTSQASFLVIHLSIHHMHLVPTQMRRLPIHRPRKVQHILAALQHILHNHMEHTLRWDNKVHILQGEVLILQGEVPILQGEVLILHRLGTLGIQGETW